MCHHVLLVCRLRSEVLTVWLQLQYDTIYVSSSPCQLPTVKVKVDNLYSGSKRADQMWSISLQNRYYNTLVVHWTSCRGCHKRRVDMKAFARYQLILLGKQRHIGVNNLPKVVARQCCGRESNPWSANGESETLPLHLRATIHAPLNLPHNAQLAADAAAAPILPTV